MGPKWSLGMLTMMRPEDALARPDLTALSVVKASSGRSSLLILAKVLALTGRLSPILAIRMTLASAVLMRGFEAHFAGMAARQVGQVFLPCWAHLLKHPRQKLCWHGACSVQQNALSIYHIGEQSLGVGLGMGG